MCSWDIISDLMEHTTNEYPDIDIRKSKKKHRQRVYERMIIDEIVDHCCERIFNDPIDIVESYELVYSYRASLFKDKNHIYRIQLRVIRKILIFLRRRFARYG